MYTLRRWWDRHRLQIILAILTLGTGWFIRETQGTFILELYKSITFPFNLGSPPQERLENARVRELEQRLVELENQNLKLKELLNYVETQPIQKQKGVAAPIIGRSADHWWQQLTLGRGSKDGVKEGFIVMAPGGVIGRVVSVTPHTSRVLLITDPSSKVGVILSRSRYMGYVRGDRASRVVMQFFDKVPDVRRGDVVSTSAVSKLYPSGLPIGRVEAVNLEKTPAPEAIIELSAPVMYLEWVFLYPKPDIKD